MQRRLGLVVAGMMVIALSVYGTGAKEQQPVTLKVLMVSGCVNQFNAINPVFEKENPGVKIEMTSAGFADRQTKIVTTLPTDPGAWDVVAVDNSEVGSWAAAGWLADISSKMTKALTDDMLPGAAKVLSYKNGIYGIPWSLAQKGLFYNLEMLKKAGYSEPPRTWDELIAMSKKMQAQGIAEWGITFGWGDMSYLDFYIFANLFGIDKPISDEGLPQFNNPKGIAALKYMRDLVETSKVASPTAYSSGDHEVMTSFLGGKSAFQLNWPFIAASLDDASQSSVVGQARIGLIPGMGTMKSSSYIGTMGISATSGSKNKDLAIKYVLFSGRKDMHKQMILVSKEVPILKSLVEDKEIQANNPLMLMMAEQFKYSVNPPMFPWWPEVSPKFNTALNKALSGMVSIEDGIAEAAKVLTDAAAARK